MNFLSELSRRNVIRITGLYAIIGWIIVQVIATIAPMLGLPEWFGTAVLVFLMVGFPIVALGTWAFEMTPEGLKREEALAPDETPQPIRSVDIIIIIGLVAVVGSAMWMSFSRVPTVAVMESTAAVDAESVGTSIAVLAFKDLSEGGDQEYFADGISEEILNLLVHVEGLQVASRTSSFQYKGRPLGIREIAEDLGVGHILEGSVRRSGDRLRITAQLIDASTDRHLWSDNFDRDMTDIFTIQDEIANAIVTALADRLGLSPEEANVDVVAATDNLSAYDAYLEGRALFLARSGLERAILLLERAVELDPEYAEAWETLAATYVIMPPWGFTDREYISLAEEAANRVIAIDPDRSMPYAVLSGVVSNSGGSERDSLNYLDMALERDPRNITAVDWRAESLFAAGFLQQSLAETTRCLEIDPGYTKCRNRLIGLYHYLGDNGRAVEEFHHTLTEGYRLIYPGAFLLLLETGHREEAMLFLGAQIGFSAPLGAIVDAITAAETNTGDAFAQLVAYRLANPRAIDDVLYFVLSLHLGENTFAEVDPEAIPLFPLWNSNLGSFRQTEAFKQMIRENGINVFWQGYGFPPQCRPVGDDDFECD